MNYSLLIVKQLVCVGGKILTNKENIMQPLAATHPESH